MVLSVDRNGVSNAFPEITLSADLIRFDDDIMAFRWELSDRDFHFSPHRPFVPI